MKTAGAEACRILPRVATTTTDGLPVHLIDADTYSRMVDAGLLEGQRVELLDGIIADMSPQSPEHAAAIARLTGYLARFGDRLRVQLPLRVTADSSLPEPDLAVVTDPPSAREHPRDALLVIEVATTSQQLDRGRKARLYAETGVPVYWVVDVTGGTVEVRARPAGGEYTAVRSYTAGDAVPAPIDGLPALAVAELLPRDE